MNYSGISECDVLNGTGFRVVLFVSGCSHKCYGCQNPETWNENFGYKYTEKTEIYILECLSKDYIDGLTLTGGDPLYESNLDSVLELLQKIRIQFGNTKTVWLYSGYTYEQAIQNEKRKHIIELCNIMVDGGFESRKKDLSLQFRGSSNQRLINIEETLKKGKATLWNRNTQKRILQKNGL